VSRRERTVRAALFSWVQAAVALAAGFWVTRLLVLQLGESNYALYVTTTTLAAWAGLSELGLLAILPWLVAEAEADGARLGRTVGAAAVAMAGACALYAAVGAGLFWGAGRLLELPPGTLSTARQALGLGLALGLLGFPLRLATAVLAGLQDVTFVGAVSVAQVLGTSALTAALVWAGYGLDGAVGGLALPPVLAGLAAVVRLRRLASERGLRWQRPTGTDFRELGRAAASAALSTTGWQLTTSAQALGLSRVGQLDAVAQLAVTSRLPLLMMQQAWTLPDAALVGLAQLKGEGLRVRARAVVRTLLQFQALVGAGVTAAVLGLNPAFVTAWVGPSRYGGDALNAALALHVAVQCLVHALVTPAAVMGNRLAVGVATFLGGAGTLVCALVLAHRGAEVLLVATAACALLTTVPAGVAVLRASLHGTQAAPDEASWKARALPRLVLLLGLAWPVQWLLARSHGVPALLAATAACGALFLFATRPLWQGLPLSDRQLGLLRRLRVIP
jgi:O-antigen/teichoic acid export membrane protein